MKADCSNEETNKETKRDSLQEESKAAMLPKVLLPLYVRQKEVN